MTWEEGGERRKMGALSTTIKNKNLLKFFFLIKIQVQVGYSKHFLWTRVASNPKQSNARLRNARQTAA